MKIEQQHKQYRIVTTSEYNDIQSDYEYIIDDANQSNDKLKENYTKTLFKDDPILYSVVYKDNLPWQFSNVITRDIFSNGVRLLNRLYVITKNRDNSNNNRPRIPYETLLMVKQQQELSYKIINIDYVFMSREFNSCLFMKKMTNELNQHLNLNWKYEKQKFKVCNSNTIACQQWICWSSNKLKELPLIQV